MDLVNQLFENITNFFGSLFEPLFQTDPGSRDLAFSMLKIFWPFGVFFLIIAVIALLVDAFVNNGPAPYEVRPRPQAGRIYITIQSKPASKEPSIKPTNTMRAKRQHLMSERMRQEWERQFRISRQMTPPPRQRRHYERRRR